MVRAWPAALLVFSVLGLALHAMNTPITLRFAYAPANYWFVAVATLALPVSLGLLALQLRRSALRVAFIVACLLVALPSIAYAVLAIGSARNGLDGSFQLLSEAPLNGVTFRLYLSNCGATCAYGLVLRREQDVAAVRLISEVWEADREEPASLRVSPSGTVEVHRGEYVLTSIKP